jgi:hypothetical protein
VPTDYMETNMKGALEKLRSPAEDEQCDMNDFY